MSGFVEKRREFGLPLTVIGDQIGNRSHEKLLLVHDSPETPHGGSRVSEESSEVKIRGRGDNDVQPWNDEVTDEFYDWLFEKSWAVQYYIEDGVMILAIDQISEEDALIEIRSGGFEHLNIRMVQPSPGEFTECADHDRGEGGNSENLLEGTPERTALVPGTKIRSGSDSNAVFSSFVGIAGSEETHGLTVGHMFDELSKDCSALTPEGNASKIAECFLRPEIPCMTTDISFMKFLDGVNFKEAAIMGIRSYTGSPNPNLVCILSSELSNSLSQTQFLKMSVERYRFTDKLLKKPLHQVMILDFVSNSISSENSYVCGAPVFFLPTSDNDELEMVGIVLGRYHTKGDSGDMVVANYLPGVLRKIERNKTYMDRLFPDTEGGIFRIEVSSTYIIANS